MVLVDMRYIIIDIKFMCLISDYLCSVPIVSLIAKTSDKFLDLLILLSIMGVNVILQDFDL